MIIFFFNKKVGDNQVVQIYIYKIYKNITVELSVTWNGEDLINTTVNGEPHFPPKNGRFKSEYWL